MTCLNDADEVPDSTGGEPPVFTGETAGEAPHASQRKDNIKSDSEPVLVLDGGRTPTQPKQARSIESQSPASSVSQEKKKQRTVDEETRSLREQMALQQNAFLTR